MDGNLLTIWTIRASLALYAVVLFGWLVGGAGSSRWMRAAKWLWAGGCVLFLGHMAAAFHYHHQWSHSAAFAHTAIETERVIGVRFGWGIYFNHLFAALWLFDAAWWLFRPDTYLSRGRLCAASVHAYLFFIALNGAVVFEGGVVRIAGLAALAALAAAAAGRSSRPSASPGGPLSGGESMRK